MSVFRSTEGREKIRARYNEILDQFPLGKRYVDTPAGKTFVIEAGDRNAPPVVLLHGSCSNGAFLLGDIMALAPKFRVLALDIPGEAGNSADHRLDFQTDESVLWLETVLNALEIPRAALIGNSFGGWMALKFATSRPERVAKLAAFVASGVVPPSALFQSEALKESVGSEKGRAELNTAITFGAALPKPVLEFLQLIGENFLPMTDAPPLFSDEALQRLTMPSLFVFAERDATLDARAAIERLGRLLPRAGVWELSGQGHIVPNIGEIALPFLAEPLELHVVEANGEKIALIDRWARIESPQDLLDAMATAGYLGCARMAANSETLGDAFFELKTGIAGEMLQKFSNYRMRLAVIGDFSGVTSKSLKDFIWESNNGSTVCFVGSLEEALARLAER